MKRSMILTVSVLLTAAISVSDAATIADMQAAAAQEIGGSAFDYVYFDFHQAGVWQYPDTSLNGWSVNDTGGDASNATFPEIIEPLSGLKPLTVYTVYVCAGGHKSAAANADWGIRAGLSSGSYSVIAPDIAADLAITKYDLGKYDSDGSGGFSSGDVFVQEAAGQVTLWAVLVGTLTTDAAGSASAYVNHAVGVAVNGVTGDRSFYDGILVTEAIPEPATLALLGLGGLLVWRKKRV